MTERATFWLIAGPNGVGKTTYALRHLRDVSGSIHFVNLDEIARGLSPIVPAAGQADAARIALARARAFIDARQTFAMETTLSGRTHLRLLQRATAAGMGATMLYFSVRSAEISLERISRRVAEGGHDVPADIVRRRHGRSHANIRAYTERCDLWRLYEASGFRPRLAVEGRRDSVTFVDAEMVDVGSPWLRAVATTRSPFDDRPQSVHEQREGPEPAEVDRDEPEEPAHQP